MPRSTPRERDKRDRVQRRLDYAIALARSAVRRIAAQIQGAGLAAWRRERTSAAVIEAMRGKLSEMREPLTTLMIYARLVGYQEAERTFHTERTVSAANSPQLKKGLEFLIRRENARPRQLAVMEQQASAHVTRVLAGLDEAATATLQKSITEIVGSGMHVKEGIATLRTAFEAAGIAPKSTFQLETIMRTQTQLAYGAGKAAVERDPDIEEALWGYRYVSAGDDRVRPAHAAMDGVTLPKDDPFWEYNYPPNGFNCRCQAIPLYRPRQIKRPAEGVIADDGFRFNPGDLLPGPPTQFQ